jgi:mono/diheme cytochrome c family protein
MIRRATLGLASALLLALPVLPATARAQGDAANGHALSRQWCTGCHVVEATGKGSDTAPSFAAIAADPATTPQRIHGFLTKPHPPMPNPPLANSEIDDITAYILSLGQP